MDSEVRNTETGEAVPPLYTARTVLNAQTQQEASQALAPKYTKFVSYSAPVSYTHLTLPTKALV